MKTIRLTQGKVALVDDRDYEELSRWKWCARRSSRKTVGDTWYAVRSEYLSRGRYRSISMHRQLLKIKDPLIKVDHKDYDGLNNQRKNLRISTNQQNVANCRRPERKLPRGVGYIKPSATGKNHYTKQRSPYTAYISVAGKRRYLGVFDTPEEAHKAYVKASLEYHGEFSPYYKSEHV